MPTSLVIGSDGLIGQALTSKLRILGKHVIETTHLQDTVAAQRIFLDMTQDISNWEPPSVDVAYLLAANTSLTSCQEHPEISVRINVENTILLAERINRLGGRVVFISTNQVFDGKRPFRQPHDPTSPVIEYGKQKAQAEKAILTMAERNTVVRISKIFPRTLPLFQNWIKSLRAGQPIQAFTDMKIAPVTLDLVIGVLTRLVDEPAGGIIHISGPEDVSYYQAACHIAERMGIPAQWVEPVLSTQTNIGALIPPMEFTTLAVSPKLEAWGLTPIPSMDVIDSVYNLEASE